MPSLPETPPPALRGPDDPREGWGLPALGTMPDVARLDDLVVRVLAPNPSPMTLDGTNTYVVMAPGGGAAAVVDPGPPDSGHLARVEQVLRDLEARCDWLVLTHSHLDHSAAAQLWARHFGARVAAGSSAMVGATGLLLEAGQTLRIGTLELEPLATPGHSPDHLAFRLQNGCVLSGDHVLGRGTSAVAFPEGDLVAYLDSLDHLLHREPAALYPGHGPELRVDPAGVLRYYLAHRQFREQQVVLLLARSAGGLTPAELVAQVYSGVDPALRPVAEASTRAVLDKLRREGRLGWGDRDRATLRWI